MRNPLSLLAVSLLLLISNIYGTPAPGPVKWIKGPRVDIDCEDMAIHPSNIPSGYRYDDYRVVGQAIVQRASYSVRYVEANTVEEMNRLVSMQREYQAEAQFTSDVGGFFTVGEVSGGAMRVHQDRHQLAQRNRFNHAALVLYGHTRRNKLFRRRSRLKVTLEIGLVRDVLPAQASASTSPPPRPDTHAELLNRERAAYEKKLADLQQQHTQQLAAERALQAKLLDSQRKQNMVDLSSVKEELAALKVKSQALANEKADLSSRLAAMKTPSSAASTSSTSTTSIPSTTANTSTNVPLYIDVDNQPMEVAIASPHTSTVEQEPSEVTHAEARALHDRLQANPNLSLTESDKLSLLSFYIAEGAARALQVSGKELIIVLGRSGVGKSTFLNYLMGCELVMRTRKELTSTAEASGISARELSRKSIVVKSVAEGGPRDAIMTIGLTTKSQTFMPDVYIDPDYPTLAYCDCPGFFDTRGSLVNIANAINIRRMLQSASCVKVLLLTKGADMDDKGSHFIKLLQLSTQLFGGISSFASCSTSVLLGITNVASDEAESAIWKDEIARFDSPIATLLSAQDRFFLYDPLLEATENSANDYQPRAACRALLTSLPGLSSSAELFQTVLTDADELMLLNLADKQSNLLLSQLVSKDYASASQTWQMLYRLKFIGHRAVDRVFYTGREKVVSLINNLERDYERACHFHDNDFTKARALLSHLESIISSFSKEDIELDLAHVDHLRTYLTDSEQRALQFKRIEENYESLQRMYEALQLAHERQRESLKKEKEEEIASIEDRIRRLELEDQAKQQKLSEALSLSDKNKDEQVRLHLQMEEMAKHHADQLARAEEEKEAIQRRYDEEKSKQDAAQAAEAQKFQTLIQASTHVQVPEEAFGAEQWKQYFGVEVVDAPSLPDDIEAILNETAPFVLDNANGRQTVRASCMLTLIPRKVKLPSGNQVPFTLDQLGQLLLDNNTGYFDAFSENTGTELGSESHGYRYYTSYLTEANRTDPHPSSPCWVLVSKDVLKHTRSKTFDDQKKEVIKYAPLYGVPRVLEVAASVLGYYAAHDQARLYADSPCTYTRCQDLDKDGDPLRVGNFKAAGLDVNCNDIGLYDNGMSCSRKF